MIVKQFLALLEFILFSESVDTFSLREYLKNIYLKNMHFKNVQ